MKFKLSIHDRLVLMGLLPKEGNLIKQILTKDILKKTDITQKEADNVKLKYNEVDRTYTFDRSKNFDKEIDFTAKEISLVQDQIKELDKNKKITQQNLDICLKFKEA